MLGSLPIKDLNYGTENKRTCPEAEKRAPQEAADGKTADADEGLCDVVSDDGAGADGDAAFPETGTAGEAGL
jgi:hypothetical protein